MKCIIIKNACARRAKDYFFVIKVAEHSFCAVIGVVFFVN